MLDLNSVEFVVVVNEICSIKKRQTTYTDVPQPLTLAPLWGRAPQFENGRVNLVVFAEAVHDNNL